MIPHHEQVCKSCRARSTYGSPHQHAHHKEHLYKKAVPYLNGLAQTCRLAYYASIHLLFQAHAFSLASRTHLHRFICDFRPIHLQSIRELTIKSLSLVGFDPYSTRRYWVEPRDLKLLKPFTELRVLRLIEIHIWDDLRSLNPRYHARDLMIELVRACDALHSLQKIVIKSNDILSNLSQYSQLAFDYDDIPGWTYSLSYITRRLFRMIDLTEALERVHRPLWPKRCEKQPVKSEATSNAIQ